MASNIRDVFKEIADGHDTPDEIHIYSVKDSMKLFHEDNRYAIIKKYIPVDVLIQRSFDLDSVWEMIEAITDETSEDIFNHVEREKLETQAMDWAEHLREEVKQQSIMYGFTPTREIFYGLLTTSNRVVCPVFIS